MEKYTQSVHSALCVLLNNPIICKCANWMVECNQLLHFTIYCYRFGLMAAASVVLLLSLEYYSVYCTIITMIVIFCCCIVAVVIIIIFSFFMNKSTLTLTYTYTFTTLKILRIVWVFILFRSLEAFCYINSLLNNKCIVLSLSEYLFVVLNSSEFAAANNLMHAKLIYWKSE